MAKALVSCALGALALGVGLVSLPLPCSANTIVTFQASGLFADGATLGGTYTVDTTTGTPIAVDLTFGAPVSSDVTILDGTTIFSGLFTQLTLNNVSGPNFYPGLTMILNSTTLLGYTGGSLSDLTTLFLNSSDHSQFSVLERGSLTPTPVPAALPLFAAGLGVLGLIARRRKRKAPAIAA